MPQATAERAGAPPAGPLARSGTWGVPRVALPSCALRSPLPLCGLAMRGGGPPGAPEASASSGDAPSSVVCRLSFRAAYARRPRHQRLTLLHMQTSKTKLCRRRNPWIAQTAATEFRIATVYMSRRSPWRAVRGATRLRQKREGWPPQALQTRPGSRRRIRRQCEACARQQSSRHLACEP